MREKSRCASVGARRVQRIDPGGGGEGEGEGGTLNLSTPLANNASINVQFVFGVQQSGRYRFYVIVEALP